MAYQAIFKRYELKYLLTLSQKEQILEAMQPYMALDQFGRTTVRNIYFDTDNYRLIRHSIEKPAYKEKLRLRSYRQANAHSAVFVELKKKYKGVVYKRRIEMEEEPAMDWVCRGIGAPDTQIGREIEYFRKFYDSLHPTVFLSYEREAYYTRCGSDFRVTFDDHILCRREDLSLEYPVWGTLLLDEDLVLMELKTPGGIPLWMTRVLNEQRLYKASYSKYGTAYQKLIEPEGMILNCKGEYIYA